jgi:DNA-binding response OmpR family regulator
MTKDRIAGYKAGAVILLKPFNPDGLLVYLTMPLFYDAGKCRAKVAVWWTSSKM